jgi:hypothetical protein
MEARKSCKCVAEFFFIRKTLVQLGEKTMVQIWTHTKAGNCELKSSQNFHELEDLGVLAFANLQVEGFGGVSFANLQVGDFLGCFFLCNFTSWRLGCYLCKCKSWGSF